MKKSKPSAQRQPGQRAISSFLFASKDSAVSRTGQANGPCEARTPPKVVVLDEEPASATEPFLPPAKRARFFPPLGRDDTRPIRTSQPAAANTPVSDTVLREPATRTSRTDNHQRFQNKLVLGIGNRKQADSSMIVPQKHTPLEVQVVELKQKHSGVLLAIEVCILAVMAEKGSLSALCLS